MHPFTCSSEVRRAQTVTLRHVGCVPLEVRLIGVIVRTPTDGLYAAAFKDYCSSKGHVGGYAPVYMFLRTS